MRRINNPPNPYLSLNREWLGPPPPIEIEVYEETARSIIAHNDSPDIPFDWSVNPYRGCHHACAYCYARPTHEYLGYGAGTDFDSKITAKINAPELLRKELARRSWRGEPIAFSGVTDCYQPLELVYELTRRCLMACLDSANPVSIVTKAGLVARDADLLAALHRRAKAHVCLSIPFVNARNARLIEPGAPPPQRRFEALRRLREAGVPTGVLVSPVIPGLNDRDIPAILEQAAAAGATSASFMPLRLPGSVRAVFLARLREALPDHAQRVENRIRDMRGGDLNNPRYNCRFRGRGEYWSGIRQLFGHSMRKLGFRSGCEECAARSTRANSSIRTADQAGPIPGANLPEQLSLF